MRLLVFLLAATCALLANAEIYKWTDSNNKVHFSDKKPDAANALPVHLQINSYTNVSYQLAPERRDSKAAPVSQDVVIYSTTWCGYCKKAKAYFTRNNIAFTDYDIEHSAQAKQSYDAFGGNGVPVIFVGESRMNGFSEEGFSHLYRQ
jgi:glutaredoxin